MIAIFLSISLIDYCRCYVVFDLLHHWLRNSVHLFVDWEQLHQNTGMSTVVHFYLWDLYLLEEAVVLIRHELSWEMRDWIFRVIICCIVHSLWDIAELGQTKRVSLFEASFGMLNDLLGHPNIFMLFLCLLFRRADDNTLFFRLCGNGAVQHLEASSLHHWLFNNTLNIRWLPSFNINLRHLRNLLLFLLMLYTGAWCLYCVLTKPILLIEFAFDF